MNRGIYEEVVYFNLRTRNRAGHVIAHVLPGINSPQQSLISCTEDHNLVCHRDLVKPRHWEI